MGTPKAAWRWKGSTLCCGDGRICRAYRRAVVVAGPWAGIPGTARTQWKSSTTRAEGWAGLRVVAAGMAAREGRAEIALACYTDCRSASAFVRGLLRAADGRSRKWGQPEARGILSRWAPAYRTSWIRWPSGWWPKVGVGNAPGGSCSMSARSAG